MNIHSNTQANRTSAFAGEFYLPSPDLTLAEPILDQVLAIRALYLRRFVTVGQIEQSYLAADATTVLIGAFHIDERTGRDALIHTLAGDSFGGLHHVPSAQTITSPDRSVASSYATRSGKLTYSRDLIEGLKRRQSPDTNGVSRPLRVTLPDGEGGSRVKRGGSTLFPDSMSAQKVLELIAGVIAQPDETTTEVDRTNRRTHKLQKSIGGMGIHVFLSEKAKIISARPVRQDIQRVGVEG